MPNRMTKEQWAARGEALESCAVHLGLDWTDDPIEREQGNIVAVMLRKLAGDALFNSDQK